MGKAADVVAACVAVAVLVGAIAVALQARGLAAEAAALDVRLAAIAPGGGGGDPEGRRTRLTQQQVTSLSRELDAIRTEFNVAREASDDLVHLTGAGPAEIGAGRTLVDAAEHFYLEHYRRLKVAEAKRQVQRERAIFARNTDSGWGPALKLTEEQRGEWNKIFEAKLEEVEPYLAGNDKPEDLDAYVRQVNKDLNRRILATLKQEQVLEYEKMASKPQFTNLLYRAGEK